MRLFIAFAAVLGIWSGFSQADAPQEIDTSLSLCHPFFRTWPPEEPANLVRCKVVGETMYIDGGIDSPLIYELRDFYPQIRHIELNSYGGEVESAKALAAMIREKGITTNVRKGAKCASACTLLFQAGVHRTAHPSSRFLYHPPHLASGWFNGFSEHCREVGRERCRNELADMILSSAQDADVFWNEYRKYGVSERFFEDYAKHPVNPEWFTEGNFSRTQDWILFSGSLVKYNIVQDFDWRVSE